MTRNKANKFKGKHRDLQRTTVAYARLLGIIDDRAGSADVMVEA